MSASSAVSSVAVGAIRGFATLHYVVAELRLEGQADPFDPLRPLSFERSFCGLETFTGRFFRRGILKDPFRAYKPRALGFP